MDETAGQRTFVGYHGTSILSVPSLLRSVILSEESNFGFLQLGRGFYVTDDYATAVAFAKVAADRVGGVPFVVQVYARDFEALVGREVETGWWWRITDDSPFISEFDYLRSGIVGFPRASQTKFNPRALGTLSTEFPR